MARTSMEAVIDRLRAMTAASRVDEFQGVIYWTDDQLEAILDETREPPIRVPLKPGTHKVGGVTAWNVMTFTRPEHYAFEAGVTVYTSTGVAVDDAYVTIDEYGETVQITLDSNSVANASYEAEVVFYNLYLAAAEVWGRKAAQRQHHVEIRSGMHQIKAQQERDFCESRQRYYRAKIGRVHSLPSSSKFASANRITLRRG